MSRLYTEFVEKEALPLVEKQYNVKLTKDPEGRGTIGASSSGSCSHGLVSPRVANPARSSGIGMAGLSAALTS